MSGLDIVANIAQAAALAAAAILVTRMASCELIKRFPFLAAYTGVAIALFATHLISGLAIEFASPQMRILVYRFDFYAWLTLAVLGTVLAIIVVIELHTHFLAPYRALQRVAEKTLQLGLLSAATVVSLGVLAAPTDAVATMRLFARFEGAVVGVALLALCGLVALFTSYFQIEAAPNLLTVLWGIGALFAGESAYNIAQQVSNGAFMGPLLIAEAVLWTAVLGWMAWQLRPQEGLPMATVARHQGGASLRRLEALNEAMTRPYQR